MAIRMIKDGVIKPVLPQHIQAALEDGWVLHSIDGVPAATFKAALDSVE